MEKIKPSEYSFEKNIVSGFENLNIFYNALKNPETKYFWDLDQVLVDSAKYIFDKFNKENPYKIIANFWDLDKYDYLTALVENTGHLDHGDLEADWYKNIPLYRSQGFKYAKLALDMAISVSGTHNNFILTSRLPRLERATNLWIKREIPGFDNRNVLIRKKHDTRDPVCYKVDMLREHSANTHNIVFVEDQEKYINAALISDVKNLLVIGIPEGRICYTVRDNRLLVLARYPFQEQEVLPLYTLFENARSQEKAYNVAQY